MLYFSCQACFWKDEAFPNCCSSTHLTWNCLGYHRRPSVGHTGFSPCRRCWIYPRTWRPNRSVSSNRKPGTKDRGLIS